MVYLTLIKKSLTQFSDKETLKLVLKTAMLTFVLLFVINTLIYLLLDWAGFYHYLIVKLSVPIFLSKIMTFIILHLVSMLLFPALLIGVSGVFLEDIAALVEKKHYPHLQQAKSLPVMQQVKSLMSLTAMIVFVNLLMIPFYFFPVINIFVFYLVNGYLISKEYFELISLRRISPQEYKKLRKRKFFGIYMGGIICSIGMTIPVLNLLVPYLSTAFMVHLFEYYND